jgi:resuscitation-promoting factor RpfB
MKKPRQKPKPFTDIFVQDVKLPKKLEESVKTARKNLKLTSTKKTRKSKKPDNKQGLVGRIISKELHKHPFAIPVITFVILSFAFLISFVFFGGRDIGSNDSYVVQLSVDGEKLVLPTKAYTVGDFLDRAKVKIKEGDVVEPDQQTKIDADDFRINIYRARQVIIVDEGKRTPALSAATTPRAIAAQVGITIYAEDNLTLTDPQEVLRNNLLAPEIVIERATPVNLNIYGSQVTLRTHANTVEELLAEKQVVLGRQDKVIPARQTNLTDNLQVFITRMGVEIATETVRIDNEVQYIDDNSLSFGTTAIRQAGSPGNKLVTYEIKLQNGVEVSRKKIQEVIVQKPVTRIVARGKAVSIPADKTAWLVAAGVKESDFVYVNYILSRESGWCPTKWQGQVGYCPPYYEPIHSESSGFGYGLCQSTPASKMASAGEDWRSNAVTQLRWCSGYAEGRYGSWEAAYNFWSINHWW